MQPAEPSLHSTVLEQRPFGGKNTVERDAFSTLYIYIYRVGFPLGSFTAVSVEGV